MAVAGILRELLLIWIAKELRGVSRSLPFSETTSKVVHKKSEPMSSLTVIGLATNEICERRKAARCSFSQPFLGTASIAAVSLYRRATLARGAKFEIHTFHGRPDLIGDLF